jgi:hypothetical protein
VEGEDGMRSLKEGWSGFRLEGRIERLRVQLAYGFEARTQHQLSSSWHVEGGDGMRSLEEG